MRPTDATFRRSLGSVLRDRRVELRLSQEHLAGMVEVTQSSISNYETGRTEAPLSLVLRLCHELSIPPVDLLERLEIE